MSFLKKFLSKLYVLVGVNLLTIPAYIESSYAQSTPFQTFNPPVGFYLDFDCTQGYKATLYSLQSGIFIKVFPRNIPGIRNFTATSRQLPYSSVTGHGEDAWVYNFSDDIADIQVRLTDHWASDNNEWLDLAFSGGPRLRVERLTCRVQTGGVNPLLQ